MSALKVVALLWIVAGAAGMVYGGITPARTAHNAKVEPFELSIKHKEAINLPVWSGLAAIVAGGVLALCAKEGRDASHARREHSR